MYSFDLLFVDVDECIFDTHQMFLNCLTHVFGRDKRYDKLKEAWEMEKVLNKEELGLVWGDWRGYNSIEFQQNIAVKPGAEQFLNSANFLDKFILTDTPDKIQLFRAARLGQLFPDYKIKFTHHALSKSQSSAKTKTAVIEDMCREYGTHAVVIEDGPHHIQEMLESEYIDRIYVFEMPYNKKYKDIHLTHVNSWKEVEELVNRTSSSLEISSTAKQPAQTT